MLSGGASLSSATIIGFGQLGGSNTPVPADLASRAVADGNGFVVSNGATPNITLTWDADWDIHTSPFFDPLESHTVGGGAWDNEGNVPRIAQLDTSMHTIDFSADPGYVFILESFDFGHTAETPALAEWNLTLTDSNAVVVWSQVVQLDSSNPATATTTITPGFVGNPGETYRLTFDGVTVPNAGRHGIDNLSFVQRAVPEPGSAALIGLAAAPLLRRRRR